MAQLAEQSLKTPEDIDSNPAMIIFKHIYLLSTVEKKNKEKQSGMAKDSTKDLPQVVISS